MPDPMSRPLLALTLAALLAAGPALAQTTEGEAEPEEVPAAEAETGADADSPAPGGSSTINLDTGTPVGEAADGAPAQQASGPQIYLREEHGDWEVRCIEAPEGQTDPCQLFQRLEDANGNPTADVNIFDLPDGNEIVAGATILAPLQTLLTAQLTMTIDSGQPRRYPFAFCDASGCYARLGLTAEDVNRMRRGAMATVVVVPAALPDQTVELEMSLTGFTAGLAAIEVANPE